MAFLARRAFVSFRGSLCGVPRVFPRHAPRISLPGQKPWGHERIPTLYGFGTRGYHSGYGSSSGPNWDGLVYSMMANLRGQMDYGPECFHSAINSDLDSDDDKSKKQRDIRDLIPLRLNRSSLSATARDISLRMQILCKNEIHTSEYAAVQTLIKMIEKLAAMPSDNPKLELQEYVQIWTTIRDGISAANDLPLQIFSINELQELGKVKWNAECVWGIAVLNAAVRNLEGTKIQTGQDGEDDVERRKTTFAGDLRNMSFKIYGLLLDSKDFCPEGERWFDREQEERILEAVIRVFREAGKRRDM